MRTHIVAIKVHWVAFLNTIVKAMSCGNPTSRAAYPANRCLISRSTWRLNGGHRGVGFEVADQAVALTTQGRQSGDRIAGKPQPIMG